MKSLTLKGVQYSTGRVGAVVMEAPEETRLCGMQLWFNPETLEVQIEMLFFSLFTL